MIPKNPGGVPRQEIFLETKLWPSFYENEDAVDRTLERLGTDYIDPLLLHQPAGCCVAGHKAKEKACSEGKVRAIGLSNFDIDQIREILGMCKVRPSVLQTEIYPNAQQAELKAYLDREAIVMQAWFPLGHGDRALVNEPVFTRLAEKHGKSNPQIILRWYIQNGHVVIPGTRNADHICDNLDVFDFALTDDEMAEIAALNSEKRYYNRTPQILAGYAAQVPPVDDEQEGQTEVVQIRRDEG